MKLRLAPFTLLTVLGLGACSGPLPAETTATTAETLHGTHWTLQSWSGHPDNEALRRIDLRFDGGHLGGEGPCNQYGADFSLDRGNLRLGPVVMTKRGCEAARMRLEADWVGALGAVQRLQVAADSLTLSGADGLLLQFERATPPSPDAN